MKIFAVDNQKLRGALWGKQKDAAVALDMHPTTLSRKIHGRIPITIEEVNGIARFLKQDATDFLKPVEDTEHPRSTQCAG